MQEEIWKDVVGYEGLYQVSNLGRVRSLDRYVKCGHGAMKRHRGGILKQFVNKQGYLSTSLSSGTIKTHDVHRLKAIAFIPNPENKPCVNHRDGVKTNNGYHADGRDNLEWATYSENNKHAFDVLNKEPSRAMLGKFGVEHGMSKPVIQYDKNGIFIAEFASATEANRILGISNNHISDCCYGRIKSSGGFIWKFKSDLNAKT